MHFRLRELASPSNPPLYPNIHINDDILSQSLSCFVKYVKSKYISSYVVTCNVMIMNCYMYVINKHLTIARYREQCHTFKTPFIFAVG